MPCTTTRHMYIIRVFCLLNALWFQEPEKNYMRECSSKKVEGVLSLIKGECPLLVKREGVLSWIKGGCPLLDKREGFLSWIEGKVFSPGLKGGCPLLDKREGVLSWLKRHCPLLD